jgi:hypothetical protein
VGSGCAGSLELGGRALVERDRNNLSRVGPLAVVASLYAAIRLKYRERPLALERNIFVANGGCGCCVFWLWRALIEIVSGCGSAAGARTGIFSGAFAAPA